VTFAFALRALRRHIILILVTAVVVSGAVFALGTNWPKTYTSKAQILLGLNIAGSTIDAQTANLYLKDRAMTYAQLVTADEVINPVAAASGTSADLLRERVVGSIVPETVVLGVSVTGSTPEEAVALTQAVTSSFMTQVSSLNVLTGGPTILPAQLSSPQPSAVPDQLHGKMLIAVSVLAGLVIAALLAMVFGVIEAGRAARRAASKREDERGEDRETGEAAAVEPAPADPDQMIKEAIPDDLPQAVNGSDRRLRAAYLTVNANPAMGYPQRRDRARERGTNDR
jgi:capsular polysaccharide biosynthesis protein